MGYLSNKLGDPNNLGYFATESALTTAYPVAFDGAFAIVGATDTFWVWDSGTVAWIDTGNGVASGDMLKAVYDPTAVNGDAFSMGNMAETASEKILTLAERGDIALSKVLSDQNRLFLGASFNNGFFEGFNMEIVEDAGSLYVEIWSSTELWLIGTTYNRGDQVLYNNFRYYCLVDGNIGNQPDTNPADWEQTSSVTDMNLHGFIDGTSNIHTLDTTTGAGVDGHARILVTPGTKNVPVTNFVWAELGVGTDLVLNSGTSIPIEPIIDLGEMSLPDVTTFLSEGADSQQRKQNALYRTSPYYQGFINAIAENIRGKGVTYVTGVDATFTITPNGGGLDSAILNLSTGEVTQLWKQMFPAFTGTPKMYIVNHPTDPNKLITDLNEIDVDANNNTLRSNNSRYGIEIIPVQASGTNSVDRINIYLPNGSYSTDDNAINDVDNLTNTEVPDHLKKTSFRAYRIVMKYQTTAGGTLTELAVQNRRNWPIGGAGGGSGTGSQVEFSDAVFRWLNATDPTKTVKVDLSAITTATERLLSFPDVDIDLADIITNNAKVGVTTQISTLEEDTTPQLGGPLDANSHSVNLSKGADVVSAAALDLGVDGNSFDITGTTAITSIVTKGVGTNVVLHFDDILTLTHSAADLVLPTGANIITAAGDIATFYEYATGDWRCVSYTRADGTALAGSGGGGADYAMISVGNVLGFLSANQVVPLSIEHYDTGNNVSLSSSQFTLQVGTYIIGGEYIAWSDSADYGYIYNITDSIEEYKGGVALSTNSTSTSSMKGIITVTGSSKTFELRSGLGRDSLGASASGVYGDSLTFVKIA